MDCLL